MVAEIYLSGIVLVLMHLSYDVMLSVIVIDSTCKDKRKSGKRGISLEFTLLCQIPNGCMCALAYPILLQ